MGEPQGGAGLGYLFGLPAGLGESAGLWDFGQILGLQSKRPHYEYQDRYKDLRPLVKQFAVEGQPEWQNLWQKQWEQLQPQILETTRAKRNIPYSTPETMALGQAGQGLMTNLAQQDLASRLQALGLFSQMPYDIFSEDVTSVGQNAWGTLGPLVAYLAGQGMKAGASGGMLGGTSGSSISPSVSAALQPWESPLKSTSAYLPTW